MAESPIDARAEQLRAGLLARRPDLGEFPEALAAYVLTEARVEFLHGWLDKYGGLIDEGGNVSQAALYLEKLIGRAERQRSKLGLDPLSAAMLVRTRAEVVKLAGGTGEDVISVLTAQGAKALEGKR